ncbi:FkbM family methyltransferase [uncultured Desulfovibrio sp.]|uniref:FkbM family methyltransferase n=1 Tax=uncultured Desulfovibrio sp. TaxID=167968 RepID=UPI00260BBC77|nr:FkbM family methyltransferase [uncultured Desulfovibrio sp.]
MIQQIKHYIERLLFVRHAKYISTQNSLEQITDMIEAYTSCDTFTFKMTNFSLLKEEQKPEYADVWFSERQVHDECYNVFSFFKDNEYMILDIGANAGYSVTSFYSTGVTCPIFSFEAFNIHQKNLEYIKNKIAPLNNCKYNFSITGLSDEESKVRFMMPVINQTGISALARSNINDPQALANLIDQYIKDFYKNSKNYLSIAEFDITLSTLDKFIFAHPDDFQLPVAAMKIDVEGMEYNVLRGAVNTIKRFIPLIMSEGDDQKINSFLTPLGYHKGFYSNGCISFDCENKFYNVFYVHKNNIPKYKEIGLVSL